MRRPRLLLEATSGWTEVSMSGAIACNECDGCKEWTVEVYAQPVADPCE
jgi:hypothetical protein